MKTLYVILTILFWMTLLLGAITFVRTMGQQDLSTHGSSTAQTVADSGTVIGAAMGAALLPGLIYLIRYFVGKEIKK